MKTPILALAAILCSSVFSFAQLSALITPPTDTPTAPVEALSKEEADLAGKVMLVELRLNICSTALAKPPTCKNIPGEMATLYAQVARSPKVIRLLAMTAIAKSQSVDQQNAKLIPLLILQNQRIIELLEQIVKKPK
jgi:hypothetical protein